MNRNVAGLKPLPKVIDVGWFITTFVLLFLCILFIGKAEFLLLAGLCVIVICVGLYLAEPQYRGVAVVISLIGAILWLIYFFG